MMIEKKYVFLLKLIFMESFFYFFHQSTLTILKLSDNLFGDSLNPIFSTPEFHALIHLRILDLSGNKIKALEEGIFKGCEKLQVKRFFIFYY